MASVSSVSGSSRGSRTDAARYADRDQPPSAVEGDRDPAAADRPEVLREHARVASQRPGPPVGVGLVGVVVHVAAAVRGHEGMAGHPGRRHRARDRRAPKYDCTCASSFGFCGIGVTAADGTALHPSTAPHQQPPGPDGRSARPLTLPQQRAPRHRRGLPDREHLEEGRRDVGEDAAVASVHPRPVTTIGTGFVECAVFGEPSGSSIWSALPWSAVIRQLAAGLVHAPHDVVEAGVDRLDGRRPPPGSHPCGRPCRGWRS